MNYDKRYVVSPNQADPNVWTFAFTYRGDAEKFAALTTRALMDAYRATPDAEMYSGCEGLLLYVLQAEGTENYTPLTLYADGKKLSIVDFSELDQGDFFADELASIRSHVDEAARKLSGAKSSILPGQPKGIEWTSEQLISCRLPQMSSEGVMSLSKVLLDAGLLGTVRFSVSVESDGLRVSLYATTNDAEDLDDLELFNTSNTLIVDTFAGTEAEVDARQVAWNSFFVLGIPLDKSKEIRWTAAQLLGRKLPRLSNEGLHSFTTLLLKLLPRQTVKFSTVVEPDGLKLHLYATVFGGLEDDAPELYTSTIDTLLGPMAAIAARQEAWHTFFVLGVQL